jgi:fructose transport system ATP-binding protein
MKDRSPGTVVLRTENLTKHYGGVEALTDVNFEIRTGDVVALVGDNGAGKSTFAKMISGAISPTAGKIEFFGKEVAFKDPAQARELGIEAVYQDLALVPHIDVGGNLFLGREPAPFGLLGRALGLLDLGAMRKSAWEALERLKVKLPSVTTPIGSMSGGQRQATAIARSVLWGGELIIMDEPVAALGVQETEEALKLVEDVASHGVPLVIISHNLEHVFRLANRIVVFRLGGLAADVKVEDTTPQEIVGYITGATKAQAKATA